MITRDVAGLIDSDDFTRANQDPPGGNWSDDGTSVTAAIVSNRLDISGGGGSPSRPGAKMDGSGLSRVEGFLQSIMRAEAVATHTPVICLCATGARTGYSTSFGSTVFALQEWTAGNVANLSTPSQTHANNTDYVGQLYVNDGVQEGFATGDSPTTITASASDTTNDGVAKIPYVCRGGTTNSANSAIFDDFLWMRSKNIVVTGLPSGYKAKVVNSGGSVVAEATESGGTATIDASRFGGATESVPFAGWTKLRITNGADVTIEEYTATTVYPGDEYNFTDALSVAVHDTISIAEGLRAELTPLLVVAVDTVSVAEGLRAEVTPLLVSVHDAVTVTDEAVAVLLGNNLLVSTSDSVAVAEAVTAQLTTVLLHTSVSDAITVAESRTAVLRPQLKVNKFETITVRELWLKAARTPEGLGRAEFVQVKEFVKAQMHIGGGLAVRVHETISVSHNNFYVGQAVDGNGAPDPDTTTVGPNPGVPSGQAAFGADYWIDGV